MRLLYFIYFGGVGAYFTFLNVYYREIGLSGTQIGLVNTLSPLVSIFAATMWGLLNDRWGQPPKVLRITIPGTILACLALSFVHSFPLIILFSCLMSFFICATIPLMDNTTLRLLGEARSRYGQVRVTGSFGYILATFTTGYLYEVTGLHWIFYTYAAIMGLFLLVAIRLPNEPVRISGSIWGGLGQMVRQAAWVVFAISSFLLWVSNTGTFTFIGITVREMGGTDRLIGLVSMMSAVTEIPILLTSDRLLRRFGSTALIVAAFCFFTLRGVLLAIMPAPEWAAPISMLGGISFSLFWVSAVGYANDAAPEHLKSTAQGLLFSIMNLAGMAGSLNAGWVYDEFGFRGLYWTTAAVALAGLALFTLGRIRFARR